jgi:hypothetical protein
MHIYHPSTFDYFHFNQHIDTDCDTTWVSIGGGDGGNNPPSSPPLDLRGGVMPQKPPNGCWFVPDSR